MSWPVLVRPTYDTVVRPFPELTDPPKFKPIAYKDYVNRKFSKIPIVELDS
ncbi:unnamed protein product [Arabis nemorensis]|uniref:Uncharacterized protein n=1 Tax=Arabis nemorensis TaxID=586526 RepID=A0A565CW21_9BRAS|nr:unnamed protein product [Arabis nemorensis]